VPRVRPKKSPVSSSKKRKKPAASKARRSKKGTSKSGGGFWRLLLKVGIICTVIGLVAVLGVLIAYGAIAKRFDLDQMAKMPERSVVYDRNGQILGKIHGADRIMVPLEDVSPFFIKALVTREDARFYEHGGVDWLGVVRSALRNAKSKRMVQGASTITMQLARNSFDMREKSLHRKMIEIMLARRIEKKFSKDEILELYVNRIFFGTGIHGVERASQAYFATPAKHMSLDESAMLAGIIRGPNLFSPFRHYEDAVSERDTVLTRMYEEEVITKEEYEKAKQKRTKVEPQEKKSAKAKADPEKNFALDAVNRDLDLVLDVPDIASGGLEIHTNLDIRLQIASERALNEHLTSIENLASYQHPRKSEYRGGTPKYLQGAVVLIDNATGGILAMTGGRDYQQSQFNRAIRAKRQVGSVFKPFVYAAAFDHGLFPGTLIDDGPLRPEEMTTDLAGGGEWRLQNSDGTFRGWQPADIGLIKSRNTMSVRVGHWAGLSNMLSLAEHIGFGEDLRPSPQLYIGNLESDLKTLTSAYTIFPNQGRRVPAFVISRIEGPDGDTFYRSATSGYPVISPGSSYMVSEILERVMEPGGTAASARDLGYHKPAGGKTGTTDNYVDGWFVGYTDKVTCGVWVGLDQPDQIVAKGYGSRLALPIWTEVMKACEKFGFPASSLKPKMKTASPSLCRMSGKLASDTCRHRRFAYTTEIPADRVPKEYCEEHRLLTRGR
jgi:penicillin-binding protein 1A